MFLSKIKEVLRVNNVYVKLIKALIRPKVKSLGLFVRGFSLLGAM